MVRARTPESSHRVFKFCSSNWLVLIDTRRTQITVLRDISQFAGGQTQVGKRPSAASVQPCMQQATFSALRKACSNPAGSDKGRPSWLQGLQVIPGGLRGSSFYCVLPALAHRPARTTRGREHGRRVKIPPGLRRSSLVLAGGSLILNSLSDCRSNTMHLGGEVDRNSARPHQT